MITAVAFCPHPPVLIPAVATGAAAELDGLRAACAEAIRRVVVPGRAVAVVGADAHRGVFTKGTRGTLRGFGVPVDVSLGTGDAPPGDAPPGDAPTGGGAGDHVLPLSLTVGAWLLREAVPPPPHVVAYCLAGDDALPALDDGDWALVVMGDASARRSVAAPGHFDDRAEPFDRAVAKALASGEPALLSFDVALGDDLLVAGTRAWNAVGLALAGRRWAGELLYDEAPYGVGYLVAAWT